MFGRRTRHLAAIAGAGALCGIKLFGTPAAAAPALKSNLSGADKMKQQVGYASVDRYVRSGMRVGLGTGSTAFFAVERLGHKLQTGELKDVVCVPTSEKTRDQAEEWGIPLSTLDAVEDSPKAGDCIVLDVTIDGADEIDVAPGTASGGSAAKESSDQCVVGGFHAVKGGGGALLREKMVEASSALFVCIVDESKCVDTNKRALRTDAPVDPKCGLGVGFPIPIEVTPFSFKHTVRQISANPILKAAGVCVSGDERFTAVLRRKGGAKDPDAPLYMTDNGNYIVDVRCRRPLSRMEVRLLDRQLHDIVGVVEHGLFVDLVNVVVVGRADGSVEVIVPSGDPRLGDRSNKKSR